MTARRWAHVLCLAAMTVSASASAEPRAPEPRVSAGASTKAADATPPGGPTQAEEHFRRAKELYLAGSYREAIAELRMARDLDPEAKDLVMNLGIVHEKLGRFDEAVDYFKEYLGMEGVTPAERTKAEAFITRIEGAKRQIANTRTAGTPPAHEPAPEGEALPAPVRARRGRIDALTIVTGSLAIAGLAVGTGFGIHAVTSRPDGFVTGRDGTYSALAKKASDAHATALIADVGFGAGAALALATAWLYFGRTADASPREEARRGSPRATVAPTSSGGLVYVGGSF